MAEEKVTQGERAWDRLPLPDDWPTSWPLGFPPGIGTAPTGQIGAVTWDVERAEREGWRVLTVVPAPAVSFNRAVDQLRVWLAAEYAGKYTMSPGWEITLTDEVGNPWLLIDAEPQKPYEVGIMPIQMPLSFAVFRETGALHRVIEGEVQDPALEVEV